MKLMMIDIYTLTIGKNLVDTLVYHHQPIRLAKKRVDRNPNFEHWLLGSKTQQGLQDQIIKRI